MTSANGEIVAVAGLIFPSGPDASVRLRGSRCGKCGECFYPARELCNNCSSADQEAWEFGPVGHLYTYTILMDPPASPPRAIGQVEFDGKVRVQGQIMTGDFKTLRLDMPMELARRSLGQNEQGRERVGFGFQPRT